MRKIIEVTEKQSLGILWGLIGTYIIFCSAICFLKFNSFGYKDFDLAIYSQIFWNILNGSIFNSILGIDCLGNHMNPIIFLIAPVYKIFPHPLALLFFQSAALGISALPLYLLARLILGYKWALVISFMYLAYPATAYTNFFEFHPTVFATAFLFFMLYYFYKNKFVLFSLFAFLAVICQENISLVIMMMGIYAFLKRKEIKWIILPILAGGVYFWLCLGKLMPHFNKDTIQFISIYRHLGGSFPQIIINILTHPFDILAIMFMKHKILYLIQLFGPLSFVPLLSPLSLLPALPLFMQHLLSLRATETSIHFHYTAEALPFIFMAFMFGIKNLLKLNSFRKKQFIFSIFLLSVFQTYSIFLGPHLSLLKSALIFYRKDHLDAQKEIFLKKIPSDAAVIATFEFLPRLAHRKNLYSFHHLYSGFYTISNKSYALPKNLRYALIDFNDQLTFRDFYALGGYKNIRKFLDSGKWGIVDVKGTLVLLEKDKEDRHFLYSVLLNPPEPQNKISLLVDGSFELKGYDFVKQEGGFLGLKFYWHSLNKTDKDINAFFDIIDNKGNLIYRFFEPICYRIFPTQAWKPGQFIAEERSLFIPFNLAAGNYLLKIGFLDYATGEIIRTNSNDPLGRADIIMEMKR